MCGEENQTSLDRYHFIIFLFINIFFLLKTSKRYRNVTIFIFFSFDIMIFLPLLLLQSRIFSNPIPLKHIFFSYENAIRFLSFLDWIKI